MMLNNERPTDRTPEGAHAHMAQAWQWLCEQRTTAPDNADVWHVRWEQLSTGEGWLTALTDRVLRGAYRLTPLQLQGQNEHRKAVWGAQDALVLKWVALSLQSQLPLHPSCEHVKGHGGGKPSIDTLHGLLTTPADPSEKKDTRHYGWVCRTDIRGYYRNINKPALISQVNQHVTSPVLRDLVQQYVHYTVEDGGTFHTPEKGISRGCPLSPLMGALHLYEMDEHFSQQKHIHYARYMDDIIILAKTRWSLKKYTKRLMQWFGEYGFEAHPDKTQIGRTGKGFDWMGAWLTHEGVTDIAPRAKANHREKVRRLYEQLVRLPKWKRKSAAPQVHARVSTYRKRWNIWSCMLMIASLSAQADRPIIVLSQSLPPGTTLPGGDFRTLIPAASNITQVTTSSNNNSAANLTFNANGSYIPSVGQAGGGAEWGVSVPGTSYYGIRITASDVYLVPIAGEIGICRGPGKCKTMRVDPSRKQLCGTTLEGAGDSVLANFNIKIDTSLVCRMTTTYTLYSSFYQDYAVYADITLRPFAGLAPKAGVTKLTGFYIGDGGHQTAINMDKPTEIIVSGLQCTLSAPPFIDFHTVGIVSTANKIVASADANKLSLKLTCGGTTNTSSVTVPLGYVLTPSGTGVVRSSGGLEDPNQPSFYMNFTNNGTPSCQPSSSSNIKLDGTTSQRITTVSPNQSITETQLNIGSALCSTGNVTQVPGDYEMAITAELVSY